jgi:hypothetical protein
MSEPLPFLSDDEIAGICDGVVTPGWQCKHLGRMGLHFVKKPNGKPLVARSEFERVIGAGRFGKAQNDASTGPNVTAMNEFLAKRKPHGKTAQRR